MSDLYTLSEENKILVQDILNDMFNLIISNSEISGYAFKGGFNRFSIERMLGDKISVLYSDKSTILRRIRDLYDLYIFNLLDEMLDPKLLAKCLAERGVNIKEKSTFEIMIQNKEDCLSLAKECNGLLKNGVRADKELVIRENINFKKVVTSVLSLLTVLRGKK